MCWKIKIMLMYYIKTVSISLSLNVFLTYLSLGLHYLVLAFHWLRKLKQNLILFSYGIAYVKYIVKLLLSQNKTKTKRT